MGRIAVIDMGTNSVRLMLAEIENKRIIWSKKKLAMTRLGKGVNETKMLSAKSIEDTINAIRSFVKEAESFGADKIEVIATSAVRDSKNRDELLGKIKEEHNINVKVISGEEEAELGFLGVLSGLEEEGLILVIDIGGGSTEFVVGDSNGILYSKSEDVGAVRMTGKHISINPVVNEEKEFLIQDIDKTISKTIENVLKYPIKKVIGIGGTITTVAAIKLSMDEYNPIEVQNTEINKDEMIKILENIEKMSIEERENITGLEPKRADIIYAGILIMERIIKKINFDNFFVSDFDNLEGAAYKM